MSVLCTPRARALLVALLACAGFTGAGCDDAEEPTQVMVVIDAESGVRERIFDVDFQVKSGEGPIDGWTERFSRSLTAGSDAISWPLEVALVPRAGGLNRNYLVVATARGESGGAIAQLRAISGYRAGKSLSLPLVFDGACLARQQLCDEALTCMAGACVDPHVATDELLPFDEDRKRGLPPATTAGNGAAGSAGEPEAEPAPPESAGGPTAGAPAPTECEATEEGCTPDPMPIDCPDQLCEGCPKGFVSGGGAMCTPLLTGLALSAGEIAPALNASDTRYRIELPLLRSHFSLAPLAAAGVRVEFDGQEVPAGGSYSVPQLPLGESTVIAVLSHPDHGSRSYTFTIMRAGAQRTYLKADNTGPGDNFGSSVAAANETIVVGAPNEDSNATGADGDGDNDSAEDTGAAYVFVRDGASFAQQAYLKPDEPASGAHFGESVAIDGDTIAVGAPDRGPGAVYVFSRNGRRWEQSARLESGMPQSGGRFGIRVSLRGDRLLVGATGEDASMTDSGAAYVFTRSDGAWSRTQLRSGEPQTAGWFGANLAQDGDRLVVGATGESHPNIAAGAAYVFVRGQDGKYAMEQQLVADVGETADLFGESTAIDGDTIAVGAIGASLTEVSAGAIYTFVREDGEWTRQTRLNPSNPRPDGNFGLRTVLIGGTLVTTTHDEDSSASGVNGEEGSGRLAQSGAAYVFERSGANWNELAHLKADMPRAYDRYGASVAVFGDSIVIGAKTEASAARGVDGDPSNDDAAGSGAAFVLR